MKLDGTTLFLAAAVAVTVHELMGSPLAQQADGSSDQPSSAPETPQTPAVAPGIQMGVGDRKTVHISFCQSWGMGKAFRTVRHAITERFPGLRVKGRHHPIPQSTVYASRAITVVQSGVILTSLWPMPSLTPTSGPLADFFSYTQTNKVATFCFAWFVGNIISANMQNTGAFEVYHDGIVVFSRLNTNAAPSPGDILEKLDGIIDDSARIKKRSRKSAKTSAKKKKKRQPERYDPIDDIFEDDDLFERVD